MRDTGALFGLLVLHLALAAPGAALLAALGFVALRPGPLLAAAGPAFVTGLVIVGVPLIAALVAGMEVGAGMSLVVSAAITAIGVVVAMRRRTLPVARDIATTGGAPARAEVVVAGVALVAIAASFALGTIAFAQLSTLWDDANIWSLKGVALYYHEGLVGEVFRNPDLSYVHLDYPILQPLLEASFFRAVGGVDLRLWHAELWVLGGAGLWTFAWLMAGLGRRLLWVAVVAVLALSPLVMQNITVGDADATMAVVLGCGALALGIWVERGERRYAILAALLLGGALNIKNEGLAMTAGLVLATLVAVVPGGLRPRVRDLAICFGVLAACALPWLVWVAGNPAAGRATPSPWETLGDSELWGERLPFLRRGLDQVALQLVSFPTWGLLVPAFLLVAVVLLVVGVQRRLVTYYLVGWFLAGAAVVYTYWVTPLAEIDAFEQRTGPRIVLGVVFIAGAGLAHLLHVATAVAAPAVAEPQESVSGADATSSTLSQSVM